MVSRTVRIVIIVLLSAGWIYPLFFSVRTLLDWCRLEASPVVYGTERTLNSFPFLHASQQALGLGVVWCAISLTAWMVVLIVKGSTGISKR